MKREDVWELTQQCGGVFKFTVLLQKRIQELVRGAPKLVDNPSNDPIVIAVAEIKAGLIELESLTNEEIEDMKKSLEEQAAAQSLLAKDQDGRPGDPSTQAITDFLKS